MLEQGAAIAIGLFMVGVIYQAGRFSVRIEKLEEWQTKMESKLSGIDTHLVQLADLIRGDER